MIVSELVSRIRIRLNDTQAIEFSDAELIGYLNDTLKSISLYLARVRYPGLVRVTSVSVPAGTPSVALPSDFLKEENLYWNNDPLDEIHRVQDDERGRPQYYFREGGFFKLYPVPDEAGELKIVYYPLLTVHSMTDAIPLPSFFEPVLVHAVAVKGRSRVELNPSIEAQLQEYIYRQVMDFIKRERSWGNLKKMRAS